MKVKALADRGEGGERENAERTLAAMMDRYGISNADLEGNQVSTHWIRYKTIWEKKLLHQLAYKRSSPGICHLIDNTGNLPHVKKVKAACWLIE